MVFKDEHVQYACGNNGKSFRIGNLDRNCEIFSRKIIDKNGRICDVICDEKFPYLVLGFGKDNSKVSTHMFRGECNEFEVPKEDFFNVPWASERTCAIFLSSWVQFDLSPYTDVVGYASSLSCFPEVNVECMDIPENFAVRTAFRTFSGVKGVIYPTKYPENCSKIICRNLLIESRIEFPNHCLSTGIGLNADCNSFKLDDKNLYYVRDIDVETTVHNPCYISAIPEFLSDVLIVNQKYVGCFGIIFLLFCLIIPGIIQYFGSDDKSWGSVLNQAIGTGSVFVTAILVLFNRCFGANTLSRRSFDGTFAVKNDFTAKRFASEKVEKIMKIACDTRIPPGLISNYRNSLSRNASKDGWLRISGGVSVSDLHKHGYIPILDKGLVIDCLTAQYLTCSSIEGKGNKLKLNRKRHWRENRRCLFIKESHIFE